MRKPLPGVNMCGAMRDRPWRSLLTTLVLSLSLIATFGQGFTNSAALTAALDATGTNLVITYSMTTTQGWVTLFSATTPERLATNAQPVDLAQVPPSTQG